LGNRDNIVAFQVWNQTNAILWLNGKPGSSTYSWTPSLFAGQNWGITGGLTIGNYRTITGPYYFNGNISEILIYTNIIDVAQIQSINDYLTTKYHCRKSDVVLDGDSTTVGGGVANPMTSMAALISQGLGYGVNVESTAISGHSSYNQLTNFFLWASSLHPEASGNIILDDVSGINDAGQAITPQQTESNYIAKAYFAHAFGWKYIPCTLISSWTNDLSGNRAIINPWLISNWQLFADNLCRYDLITTLSTNGAYSNLVYFISDQTHPTDAADQLLAPVAISAINSVLLGTNFNGSFNGNGFGLTNIPLTAVNTLLDDYDNIDINNVYDSQTVILPQLNGFYFGMGKVMSAGNVAFYFAPPRWPVIQFSGLTNQVFYLHIFATNGATVNWTASVRYWTNGLTAGSGFGVQQKIFAAGVFQCTAGTTNDYWIIATNSFPMNVMTNVQLAMFYYATPSPSTNVWAIQGSHIHPQ
jgi:hypothetical protein